MDYLKQFVIPFSGLKPGVHYFDFEVNDQFFTKFEYSEIKRGNIRIDLKFTKQERMFILDFRIKGVVEVVCDRCLEKFDLPISGTEKLMIKFGDEWREESDEVQIIPENEHQIDVSRFIYEFIILNIPMQKIHPVKKNGEDGCNQEMIRKIEKHRHHQKPDPRWETLLKLKTKSKS